VENQVDEAKKIAQREWLEIVDIIRESKSAKDPGRPGFNKMMSLINKWKVDCIITWKLNRLARNPIDEGSIKWSLQNGLIRSIYTQGETFRTGDNVLIMGMHFGMSTQYIIELKADSARWVKQKMRQWGVCHKAPIWYLNDIATKSIKIDPKKSKWVKKMFELRAQGHAYKTISQKLYEIWITRDNNTAFPPTTIETLLKNQFYIWVVTRAWEQYKWSYDRFISISLFEKAQNIWKGFHTKWNTAKEYYLKWIVKDKNWLAMSWYTTKGNIYYKTSSHNPLTINLSQKKIFTHYEKLLEDFSLNPWYLKLNQGIVLEILKKQKPKDESSLEQINFQIRRVEERQKELLNLRLDGELDKESFLERKNDFVRQIATLEEQRNELWKEDIEEKLKTMFELSKNLYETYKETDEQWKSVFLQNIMVELLVKNKKELSYGENSMYSCLKMLQKHDFSDLEVPPGIEPGYKALQASA
jgi:site-specific DNA recombinase